MLFKNCVVAIHLCKQCGRVLPFRPVPVVIVRFYEAETFLSPG